jgi:peptide/nickel transport system permease protein
VVKKELVFPQEEAETTVVYKKRRQFPEVWRKFRRNQRGVAGMVILLVLILAGLFAPFITPYEPNAQSLDDAFQQPSAAHWMGTDNVGRDMFTRIIYGIRISLFAGLVAVSISLVVGGILGALAGYYVGWVDNLILRFMDILLAMPSILLAISIIAALGGGLMNMLIAIGLSAMPQYCRTLRAEILKIREQEFIEAARAAGASDLSIIVRHILPNCLAPLIVRVTMGMAGAILSCSSLSFIGLGVAPPTPEWGSMLSRGREYIRTFPNMSTFPGLAIMLTIFALNLMGDALRDALDPKMKN